MGRAGRYQYEIYRCFLTQVLYITPLERRGVGNDYLQLSYPEIVLRDGETWLDHRARLEQQHTSGGRSGLSYRVLPPKVLNAADHGVPQKRERVFFVGFRSDLGAEWSFPRANYSRDALLWRALSN